MSFHAYRSRPYRCLHVPDERSGVLGAAARSRLGWVAVGVLAVAYWRVGPWLFIVPVLCVLVLAGIVVQVRWLHARGQRPAPVAVADGLDVTARPVDGGEFYVCIRCQAQRAVTVVTVRALPIPVCAPCLAPALARIEQAALEAVHR